jgi:hypothetical protein
MDYVKGCAECQQHKVNNRPTKAALEPIWAKPEATPFETVAVDFITKLPISQGYDSILTVTDHDCSKATIFIPCVEEGRRDSRSICQTCVHQIQPTHKNH